MSEQSYFDETMGEIERRDARDINPGRVRVIRQYRKIGEAFVELWREIDARTEKSDWREDGVGSCASGPHTFDSLLAGVGAHEIEMLWDALAADNDIPFGGDHACPYHKAGQGCVLGGLKPPRCIDYAVSEHVEEIRERLGVELPDFRVPLQTVLGGGLDIEGRDWRLHPERNDDLVDTTIDETRALIEKVKEAPTLEFPSKTGNTAQ